MVQCWHVAAWGWLTDLKRRQKEQVLQRLAGKPKEELDLQALQSQMGTIVADVRAVLLRSARYVTRPGP